MNTKFIENNNLYDVNSIKKNDICNLLYLDLIFCLNKYKLFKIINNKDDNDFNLKIENKDKCNHFFKMYNKCIK